MEKIAGWLRQEKRYVVLVKSVLLALLPLICCAVYCAAQGKGVGDVYLPVSEWNDELFYYKQVEGIVNYGYPLGYFGFNESRALQLSFAAWSPVLVFPWVIWGWVFGWNLMSPILCNIFLMMLCCFLFVLLVRPSWKQMGILTFLFCLYTPFVRYMLSVMPEVICFSMLILFYSVAINYLRRERAYKLALLFALSGVMTLMRPYMLLFLLLPAWFWIRKSGWKGAAGSAAVLAGVLGLYACIKHFLGAEYFAPLFFTDWVTAFFERGIWGGVRYTLGKLYYMGVDFGRHTLQGFRSGLASGAFFAGFLVCLFVLAGQSMADWRALRRQKEACGKAAGGDAAKKGILSETADRKETLGGTGRAEEGTWQGAAGRAEEGTWPGGAGRAGEGTRSETAERAGEKNQSGCADGAGEGSQPEAAGRPQERRRSGNADRADGWNLSMEESGGLGKFLVIEAHLAFSFIAMFFALLLMYKLTEGSKHLLTFMAAAVFVVSLMKTRFYKKAVLIGVTFAYFYSYMAVDPYDYQAPFVQEERLASVERWRETLGERLVPDMGKKPGYENVVIWVLNDTVEGSLTNTEWQLLYALPEGFGISCCMPDYVTENFETLQSRYLCVVPGGPVEERCIRAGYEKIAESEGAAIYGRY